MKKIVNEETLKAAVIELYEATREAMQEQTGQWPLLNKIFAHTCKMCKMLNLPAEPLPIPKSTVQGAPQLITPAALKGRETPTPPPPPGNFLADNAPKKTRRGKSKRG